MAGRVFVNGCNAVAKDKRIDMEGKGKYGRRLAIVRTSHHIALFLASGSLGQWVRRSSQSPFRLLTTQQQRSLYLRSSFG